MTRFKELYDAGAVTRFHTKRTIHTQTIAEHSWGVAMILTRICNPRAELLRAALTHDLAESVTGDTPATAKWLHEPLKQALDIMEIAVNRHLGIDTELSKHELELLKWADMLELILYCESEVDMGNTKMEGIVRTGIAYLDARVPPTPEASALLESLK